MDLITLAAAQTLAKIAFDKFVEGGMSEVGKKTTEHVANLIHKLGEVVWQKAVSGNIQAEAALKAATQNSPEGVQTLESHLNDVWNADKNFEQEIKTSVQEIYQLVKSQDYNAENIQNVYGGIGNQFNNPEIQPKSKQGTFIKNYYASKPD